MSLTCELPPFAESYYLPKDKPDIQRVSGKPLQTLEIYKQIIL